MEITQTSRFFDWVQMLPAKSASADAYLKWTNQSLVKPLPPKAVTAALTPSQRGFVKQKSIIASGHWAPACVCVCVCSYLLHLLPWKKLAHSKQVFLLPTQKTEGIPTTSIITYLSRNRPRSGRLLFSTCSRQEVSVTTHTSNKPFPSST